VKHGAAGIALACALLPAAMPAAAGRVLEVGPGRALQAPSEAARIVQPGDTVLIDAGEYRDCAVWRTDGLRLAGRGGLAQLRDVSCAGKGIWVIAGRDVTVEEIGFSGARVPDRNGAGIRMSPGASVTVRRSVFRDNEVGILTDHHPNSTLTVEDSTFEANGPSHAIYANYIARLSVRNSTFLRHRVKHHVKSRARESEVIGCRIDDGIDGTASYLIDIPNGGTVLIADNELIKGVHSQNRRTAIAIGLEGEKLPSRGVVVRNNHFRSKLEATTAFVRNETRVPAELAGNRLEGPVRPLVGPGSVAP